MLENAAKVLSFHQKTFVLVSMLRRECTSPSRRDGGGQGTIVNLLP